jgi:hypothetical protein
MTLRIDNSISPKGPGTAPVNGAYIPIFGVWDSFSYADTPTIHKHHMSLTRVFVARNGVGAPGNGHTLPCAH